MGWDVNVVRMGWNGLGEVGMFGHTQTEGEVGFIALDLHPAEPREVCGRTPNSPLGRTPNSPLGRSPRCRLAPW